MASTNSPIKLIAVDLDGTLLADNRDASPRNLEAIHRATQQGVVVAICSGRPYSSADRVAARLGLVQAPIVACNGAVIRLPQDGETLYSVALEADLAAELVADCVQQQLHLHYYLNGQMYVTRASKWAWRYYLRTGVRPIPFGDLRKLAGQRPTKLLAIGEPAHISQLMPDFQQRYEGRAYVTASMPQYLELLPLEASKARALNWLADHYGLSLRETMAIGDALNDLPMIQAAGVGVAMAEAPDQLHQAADYVTESQINGVAEAIDRFVL